MEARLRVLAEWGCHPLWAYDDAGVLVGDVDPRTTGISGPLADELRAWSDRHQAIYRADDPAGSAWPSEEAERTFTREGRALTEAVATERGEPVRYSPGAGGEDEIVVPRPNRLAGPLCPRCGQDHLRRRTVGQLPPSWVCPECEAVWWGVVRPRPDDDLETVQDRAGVARGWRLLGDPAWFERPGARFQNEVVIYLVQALTGSVPPWLQAVGVDTDAARRHARVVLALDASAPDTDEHVEDLVVDIVAPHGDSFDVDVEVWRGDDWLESPVADLRRVFTRAR